MARRVLHDNEFEIYTEEGTTHVQLNDDGTRTITYPDGVQVTVGEPYPAEQEDAS